MLPKENEISGFSWKKSANLATRGLCTTSKKTCWGMGVLLFWQLQLGRGLHSPPRPTPHTPALQEVSVS